jgi:hypothetical protein
VSLFDRVPMAVVCVVEHSARPSTDVVAVENAPARTSAALAA